MSSAKFKRGDRVRIYKDNEPFRLVGKMALVQDVWFWGKERPKYVLTVDHTEGSVTVPEDYLERVTVQPSSVLANDLFIPWDPDPPQNRFSRFQSDSWLAGRIVELLMFYDRVIIPTVDFSIVPPLVHWLGDALYVEMLKEGRLSFVRYRGALGYIGNGGGLNMYHVGPSPQKPDDVWWIKAARCDAEESVDLQLGERLTGLHRAGLPRLTALCALDTRLPEFIKRVDLETSRDVIVSKSLQQLFPPLADLKRLPGIGPNQMRCYTLELKPEVAGDPIDLSLRLGMMNLEVYLAEESGARDMVTDRGFKDLLQAKVERLTAGAASTESFATITNAEGLPDIPGATVAGKLAPQDIFKFSQSADARRFRAWFDKYGPHDPSQVLREYVAALRTGSMWGSGPTRVARFIVVTGVGLLTPIGGVLTGAIDSFLLEKIRLGYNPRYFVDSFRDRLLMSKRDQ